MSLEKITKDEARNIEYLTELNNQENEEIFKLKRDIEIEKKRLKCLQELASNQLFLETEDLWCLYVFALHLQTGTPI